MRAIGPVAQAAEDLPARFLVGRLEALQELEQGGQHLLGELGRDLVLILAALGQDRVQALAAGEHVHPVVVQDRPEGRARQAAGRFQQGLERECDIPRLLLLGPVDQPHSGALDDQAERDAGLIQQPLELLLRRFDPGGLVGVVRLAVEIDVGRDVQAEQAPARAGLGSLRPSIGETGLERVVVLNQVMPQLIGWFGTVVGLVRAVAV